MKTFFRRLFYEDFFQSDEVDYSSKNMINKNINRITSLFHAYFLNDIIRSVHSYNHVFTLTLTFTNLPYS